tara:strand:- start:3055 stop:3678 length:624 start_codon:yes stop_codon:yes gene_type:complete
MADITLEIRRIPRPGKRFEVVQSVITAIKTTGRMGVVTGSVMTPHTGDQDVVSALLFSSWDELEKMHDGIMADGDFQKQQSEIAELCSKTTIQALNVLARGDLGTAPKYMRRNFLFAKRGESAAVAETLLEWREAFPEGRRPTVQRPVSGTIDLVRVTATFGSLNSLMEASTDVATNPAYAKFRSQINSLTDRVMGYNSRVIHRNSG